MAIAQDWRYLFDEHFGPVGDHDAEQEERARQEKAAALKELAESRFSVLIGPAGTGKTTLLSILCSQEDVAAGDVLLLAPTGKARVRMEQATKHSDLNLKGYTIAQFLSRCDRYDAETGRYRLSDGKAEAGAKTVIVDEASMLTEEMLGALIDALRGVQRLVLVGDPRQLPPIGVGRPFVDIVSELVPDNVHAKFPRISQGYAELTVRRRQEGRLREDLQLAEWFSGAPLEPGEDDVFYKVVKAGASEHVRFLRWDTPEEFQEQLIEVLFEELGLDGPEDVERFDLSLGATVKSGYSYFNRGSAIAAEKWQILSPVRGLTHGVSETNRLIHRQFRSQMVELAHRKYRKIPRPMGSEQIVYGDKVINIVNHRRTNVYPREDALEYIANGEIGMIIGQFKTKNMKGLPWLLKVEFSSQLGFQYDFKARDFSEEAQPLLELAYALTVHKAQGSEFELVILVLPNPCRLLSRELIYTALTRQRRRIVILQQGDRNDLKKFASDNRSETAIRLTNLFRAPQPVEIEGRFFEDRLINQTRRGELVRSKSEVIIADRLTDLEVEYTYEKDLTIDKVTRFPDFTIEDEETGQIFYWEHCGMLQDPEYRSRWKRKLQWYRDNSILPHEEGGGSNGTL
ncbi:AAA family ATPase, partial [candidate division WOR-3 bacterium]|nr:AAA family ATPase [candidate division WOR-3 bacterium]